MRNPRNINRIVSSMIVSMVALGALAQIKEDRPTIVIGIVIDQLRSDYIELLQAHFGEDGFNRLINEGAYFENVNFKLAHPDAVSGTAVIYTGAYPKVNGISASSVFDIATKHAVPVLRDKSKIGNFTNETLSPKAINVSTVSDEVRVNSAGLGYVYSIAPDPQQAIVMAGHAANSAAWINDANGNWATTTFYKDFPSFMTFRNYNSSIASRLDTATWEPSLNLDDYPDIPTHRKFRPFKYRYFHGDVERYPSYKQSALVNEEVTSVAIKYINTLGLGTRNQLDMLNIAYTAAPYEYGIDRDYRLELQDTYIRLDKQLKRLFEAVDQKFGRGNAVIFVSSTGYFNDTRPDDPKFNIPTGEFHIARAKSLLNMYLIAMYGNGEWVIGYHDRHFFLNDALIKEKDLNLEEIRTKSAEFLRKMSGVESAYTIEEILENPVSTKAKLIHNSTVQADAGDVYIEILPGWQIVEISHNTENAKLIRDNAVNTPAFILAPSVKAQKITTVIDASELAPTVARILRIRSPNGASQKPIIL